MDKKIVLKFITGNKNKAIEVENIISKILPEVSVEALKVDDIPEPQGEPEDITKYKLNYVRKQFPEGIILVEDTQLCFEGFNGLPGPYIKDFLNKIGLDGLYKMASNSSTTRAYAQCIFGLSVSSTVEPLIFVGRTYGNIVSKRGPENFGWDPVFEPEGKDKTYAELPKDEKNEISHRYKSLFALASYIKTLL